MPAQNTITLAANLASDSLLTELLSARADLFELTQITEEAALRPHETGILSHELRAALASRIARLNNEEPLAAHYGRNLPSPERMPVLQQIYNPAHTPMAEPQLAAIVRHVDRVTCEPKNASRTDIQALQATGVSDADIVRLSELIAFVNYQLRLVSGLRLMKEIRANAS